MGKSNSFVFVSILLMTMAGCTSSNNIGCGEGYEEMYGGYEYGFNSTSVDAQNSLQVKVEIVKGSGGWWLEESETYQESQTLWVDITVKFSDGTTEEISFKRSDWNNIGDGGSGSSWNKILTFNSPDGFCDSGCEEVQFSGSFEYGIMYYDGTCYSSPWVDID
tara:strand:- start:1 stop:489 length:489 start_codon:yes stop_codon:yes gene_type:complete